VPQDERRDAGIAANEDRVAVIKKSLNSGVANPLFGSLDGLPPTAV
jgi:hypothetical protein